MVQGLWSCLRCQRAGTCCTCGRRLPQEPVTMSGGGRFMTHHTADGQRIHDRMRRHLLDRLLDKILALGAVKAGEMAERIKEKYPNWGTGSALYDPVAIADRHLEVQGARSRVGEPGETWTDPDGRVWRLDRWYMDRRGKEWKWTGLYSSSHPGNPPYMCVVGSDAPPWHLTEVAEGFGPLEEVPVSDTDPGQPLDQLWWGPDGVGWRLDITYTDRSGVEWEWTGHFSRNNAEPYFRRTGSVIHVRLLESLNREHGPLRPNEETDPEEIDCQEQGDAMSDKPTNIQSEIRPWIWIDETGTPVDLRKFFVDRYDRTWIWTGSFQPGAGPVMECDSYHRPLTKIRAEAGPLEMHDPHYTDDTGKLWDLSIRYVDGQQDTWRYHGHLQAGVPVLTHGLTLHKTLPQIVADYEGLYPDVRPDPVYLDGHGRVWDLDQIWSDRTGALWSWDEQSNEVPTMDQVNGSMRNVRFELLLNNRPPLTPALGMPGPASPTEEMIEKASGVIPHNDNPEPPVDGVTEDKIDRAAEILARLRNG